MALLTLRVLDGPDRGRVYREVPTPVTVGREEGNAVQLNDERVSRFHLKIQEDQNRVVLTDLESTNGTRVNGETTRLWVLRPGDVVSVGRSLLLYGSRDEIARRLAALRNVDLSSGVPLDAEELDKVSDSALLDAELNWCEDPESRLAIHTLLPPELPSHLTPGQAAQLSELIQFIHLRLRTLVQSVHVTKAKGDRLTVEQRQWQNVLDLTDRLATYLRAIGEPEE